MLKRIRVRYTLRLDEDAGGAGADGASGTAATARRVHEVHHRGCPVYRSISGCVDITTELSIVGG